ncbi:hypothetical protein CJ030_MR5G009751 [Morella rubra]|uniref:Uncharacterized protein n=1 Tax=Morella rubra TaxID=262757 RepID=A0A6A1VIJ0_9ROSI|nr:hypothetical protein CJ030_MR5G009751 [Morella rubra]
MDEDTWAKLCDMFADPKYEEKMRELQEQAISDGRSYNDIDILHQVLGPKLGYVRGWASSEASKKLGIDIH